MATIRYHGVGIKAIAACVPPGVYSNRDLGYLIPEDEIDKTINSIGVEERRIADPDITASDMAFSVFLSESNEGHMTQFELHNAVR